MKQTNPVSSAQVHTLSAEANAFVNNLLLAGALVLICVILAIVAKMAGRPKIASYLLAAPNVLVLLGALALTIRSYSNSILMGIHNSFELLDIGDLLTPIFLFLMTSLILFPGVIASFRFHRLGSRGYFILAIIINLVMAAMLFAGVYAVLILAIQGL